MKERKKVLLRKQETLVKSLILPSKYLGGGGGWPFPLKLITRPERGGGGLVVAPDVEHRNPSVLYGGVTCAWMLLLAKNLSGLGRFVRCVWKDIRPDRDAVTWKDS